MRAVTFAAALVATLAAAVLIAALWVQAIVTEPACGTTGGSPLAGQPCADGGGQP